MKYVSYFSQLKKIGHFMQIVSNGDNLLEISNPVFWGKNKKKCHQYVICKISPDSGKG